MPQVSSHRLRRGRRAERERGVLVFLCPLRDAVSDSLAARVPTRRHHLSEKLIQPRQGGRDRQAAGGLALRSSNGIFGLDDTVVAPASAICFFASAFAAVRYAAVIV